jgi:putative copper resistance protein D
VETAETLLHGWIWATIPAVALVAAAGLYGAAAVHVGHLQPSQLWPRRHTICFLAGIATMWVALLGPPGYFDDVFFYAHMTQHIMLTMVAVPLLVLGEPVLLCSRAAPRRFRRRWIVPVLRGRVAGLLTHPVVGWLLFVGVMVVSHVPTVYDYALSHPPIHDYVEHPVYVASAFLYFYPLLGATAGRRFVSHGVRVASLLTTMIPMAFIGFFIYAAPRLSYPFYAHVPRPFGPDPTADQHFSGALMWSSSMILGALWAAVTGMRWLRAEERRTHRVDRAVARSIAAANAAPPREAS